MLKQCLINVDFSRLHAKQQLHPKCGEIFYESDNDETSSCSFHLVCCLCEMKHFAFDDFSMHIRNVHFDKEGKPRTHMITSKTADSEQELKLSVKDANDLLTDEASDEDVDNGETLTNTPLRICAFDKFKSEPRENNETTHFECSSQSEDELEDMGAEEDLSHEEADSELDTQSIFKVSLLYTFYIYRFI